MDWEALSFVAAGIAVAVSLAAFIATGIRSIRTEISATRTEFGAIRTEIQAQSQQFREDLQTVARQHHEDFQTLVQQQREGRTKLENAIANLAENVREIAQRTARIETVLVSHGMLTLPGTVAQGISEDEPREP